MPPDSFLHERSDFKALVETVADLYSSATRWVTTAFVASTMRYSQEVSSELTTAFQPCVRNGLINC